MSRKAEDWLIIAMIALVAVMAGLCGFGAYLYFEIFHP